MPKTTLKRARKGPVDAKNNEKSQSTVPNTKGTDNSTTSERDALELKSKELVTSLKYAGRAAKVPVYPIIALSSASCVPTSPSSPFRRTYASLG
jgi:hypothetical protein